ncbi:MAG: diaminopimelate epimerase [Clostridiales bacterium]|nr:diaminopimelate epimerase [Clostridiales bacterium]
MKFTKMQGIGNDYIYINCFTEKVEKPGILSMRLSDRHTGIGSDGLVLIKPSETADFMMDMYNADGSQGKMCGNAIRCVGKYVYDHKMTDKTEITIETLSGIKTVSLILEDGVVTAARVDMGAPEFDPEKIPVALQGERVVDEKITVNGRMYKMTCVSMGNPHAVVFINGVDSLDLNAIGPQFEAHPFFPDRVNTEFVQVVDRTHLRMRVWERGSGETMACGTGACATLVAAVVNGKASRKADVILNGGVLRIEWDEETGHVFMTGGAKEVFTGEVKL